MATITNVIRWADNADQLSRNLAEGIDQVEVMTGATRRMVESFDGTKLEREAHKMVAAVTEVGGASRLSEAEQAKVNRTLEAYIEKAELMGRAVPTAMRELAEETRQAAEATEGLGARITGLIAAGEAARAAIGGLVDIGRDWLSAATDQEDATVRLDTALRAQGSFTPQLSAQYADLAAEFQNTTIHGDDLLQEMEALLVTIGGVMPRDMRAALTASTDLAAGLRIDLQSATTLVARALEGNTGALGRYGIHISEARLKTEGAAVVFQTIAEKMGGQAAVQAQTLSGQMSRLGNVVGETKETFGGFIGAVLQPAIDLFMALPGPVQTAVTGFGLLGAAGVVLATAVTGVSAAVALALPLLGFSSATSGLAALSALGNAIPVLTARLWLMQAGVLGVSAALGAAAIIAASAFAVYQAGSLIWKSVSEEQERATMRTNEGARQQAMMAEAARISGAAVTEYKNAVEIVNTHLAAQNQVQQDTTRSINEFIGPVESMQAALQHTKQAVAALTGEQRSQIRAGVDLGMSTAEIAARMNQLFPTLNLTTAAVDRYKQQLTQAEAASKKMADATKKFWEEADKLGRDSLPPLTGLLGNLETKLEDVTSVKSRSIVEAGKLRQQLEAWANTNGAVLAPTIAQVSSKVEEATEKTSTWAESLGPLSQALGNMAQVAGGSFGGVVQHMATMITSMHTAGQASTTMQTGFNQLSGENQNVAAGLINIGTGAIAAASAFMQATAHGNTFQRTLSGLMVGAQIGSAFGPIGMAIGAAVGGLGGFLRGMLGVSDAIRQARTDVENFQEKLRETLTATQRLEAGGRPWAETVIVVRDAYLAVGRTAEEADRIVRQLWDTDHPNRARAAMEEINRVLEEQKALLADEHEAMQILTAAAQRYGFTIDELGPTFQRQRLSEMSQQLDRDFRVLVASGIDVERVAGRMAEATNEYLHMALRTGAEVPASMRPMLERMAEMGLLTDESGIKMSDLGRLTFAETLTQGIDRIVAAIERLASGVAPLPFALENTGVAGGRAAGQIEHEFRTRAIPAIEDTAEAVDALNFGSSPGGLKEIPILMRAAGLSIGDFKDTFTSGITVCGGILDNTFQPKLKGIGLQFQIDLPADVASFVSVCGAEIPKVGDLFDDVVLRGVDPFAKKLTKDLPDGVSLLAIASEAAFPKMGDLLNDTFGKAVDETAKKLKTVKDLVVDLGGDTVGRAVPGPLPPLPPSAKSGKSFDAGTFGAFGRFFHDFGARGTPVVVHNREAIIREDQSVAFAKSVLGSTGGSGDTSAVVSMLSAVLGELRRQPEKLQVAMQTALTLAPRGAR